MFNEKQNEERKKLPANTVEHILAVMMRLITIHLDPCRWDTLIRDINTIGRTWVVKVKKYQHDIYVGTLNRKTPSRLYDFGNPYRMDSTKSPAS